MDKYRIKLNSGRIVGPLELKDVIELTYKNKLQGNEEVQYFPVGEWLPFEQFRELHKIHQSQIRSLDEETFIANIDKIEITKSDILKEPSEIREFKFEHVDPILDVILDEVEEQGAREQRDDDLYQVETQATKKNNVEPDNSQDLDKTLINPGYQAYLLEEKCKKEEEEKRKKEENKEKESEKEPSFDFENEATQFMSIDDIIPEVEQALIVESDIDLELKQIEAEKKKRQEKKIKQEQEEQQSEKEDTTRLRRLMVYSAVALLFVYFILPDEKPVEKQSLQPIKIVEPQIIFPSRYDRPDSKKAVETYNAGKEEFRKYTYESAVKASQLFKTSLMNKFDDNPAMHRLIFSYSRTLINSESFIEDANAIFKLVLISKSKTLSSPYFASAIAYFFLKVGKTNAALATINRYKSLPDSANSLEFASVALKVLVEAGEFVEAEKLFIRIDSEKSKHHFAYEAIYEYAKALGQTENMVRIIKEAKKRYPESVYFDLEAGLILADGGKVEDLKKLLFKLNRNNVEGSKWFYSKYLILKGLYHAFTKRPDLALKDFESSLKLFKNLDLIEKLSVLKESGNDSADKLIADSKALKEVKLAERAMAKGDYDQALKFALSASDISPTLIEAKLLLADIQLKKGYIDDAIVLLKKLRKSSLQSTEIIFKLIDAHIQAYQFKEALNLLGTAIDLEGAELHQYYSAKAKFSLYRGNLNSAMGWLQRAIDSNPINDGYIYQLANLFVKNYRFSDAKKFLNRAMDLDPSKIEYKILFAKILYEVENSQAAIGYLRGILKLYPDNPMILSEIGIYYYRSGQIKNYKETKKELYQLPEKTASLYRFLIESARLDDDINRVIENQEELLSIEPGDLEVRMELASTYIDQEKYKKAKRHLTAINNRLKTYPRLNLNFARMYLLVDDIEKAKEMAFKEMKANPSVDNAYVLLGDIFRKEENYIEANKYYIKAIQINPKNTDAILGVAYIAFRGEQFELALDQYQRVVEFEPNRTEVYKLLGDAYRKLGQSQLAIKYYQDFLTRSPDSKYKTKIETYIRNME